MFFGLYIINRICYGCRFVQNVFLQEQGEAFAFTKGFRFAFAEGNSLRAKHCFARRCSLRYTEGEAMLRKQRRFSLRFCRRQQPSPKVEALHLPKAITEGEAMLRKQRR